MTPSERHAQLDRWLERVGAEMQWDMVSLAPLSLSHRVEAYAARGGRTFLVVRSSDDWEIYTAGGEAGIANTLHEAETRLGLA